MSNQKQSKPNNNRRDYRSGKKRETHGKTNFGQGYGRPHEKDTLFDMIRPLLPPGEFEKPAEHTDDGSVNNGQDINVDNTKADLSISNETGASQGISHDMNNNDEGGNSTASLRRNNGPPNNGRRDGHRGRGRRSYPNNYQMPMPPYNQPYYPMPAVEQATPPAHVAVGQSVVGPNSDGSYYLGRIINVNPYSQSAFVQFMPSGNCWHVYWNDLQPYSA